MRKYNNTHIYMYEAVGKDKNILKLITTRKTYGKQPEIQLEMNLEITRKYSWKYMCKSARHAS